jgi:hypothetical protein
MEQHGIGTSCRSGTGIHGHEAAAFFGETMEI